jgi:hypothetical protein
MLTVGEQILGGQITAAFNPKASLKS